MTTRNVARKKDWSDLDLDFLMHPTTKDVVKKKGVEAIKRSIRNLVLLNFYEKKFRHGIGSSAQKILFDNIDPMTAIFLRNAIIEVIQNYEPRARLVEDENRGVRVEADLDNNGYRAQITFHEVNSILPITITLFLERIR